MIGIWPASSASPAHPMEPIVPDAPAKGRVEPRDREHGFVLIAVLWGLALVTLLMSAAMTQSRQSAMIAANLRNAAEARLMANGMVRLLAFKLAQRRGRPEATAEPTSDGRIRICAIATATAWVSIQDVSGLVDLNAAPPALLQRLFEGLGEPPESAAALSAAIIDFRDADETASPYGAEAPEYAAAGLKHGPKNAPFDVVGELDQVLGMRRDLFEAARPLVTVQSRFPGLDPTVAPEALKQALVSRQPGLEKARERSPSISEADWAALGELVRFRSQARAFVVTADVLTDRGGAFRREAVVELGVRSPTGYRIRSWTAARTNVTLPQRPIIPISPCAGATF